MELLLLVIQLDAISRVRILLLLEGTLEIIDSRLMLLQLESELLKLLSKLLLLLLVLVLEVLSNNLDLLLWDTTAVRSVKTVQLSQSVCQVACCSKVVEQLLLESRLATDHKATTLSQLEPALDTQVKQETQLF